MSIFIQKIRQISLKMSIFVNGITPKTFELCTFKKYI
jgi:hypothetical protein